MIARKMGNSTTVLLVEKVEKGIGNSEFGIGKLESLISSETGCSQKLAKSSDEFLSCSFYLPD